MRDRLVVGVSVLLLSGLGSLAEELYPTLAVTRLNQNQPIIDYSSFAAVGIAGEADNIDGPCCVRVPDWVAEDDRADPTAQYYLYFANHHGDYIRMAWAATIEGPWTLFNCGSNDDARVAGDGVFDLGTTDEVHYTSDGGIRVYDHIASPDVVVDHTNQQFLLYFHGKTEGTTEGDNYFDTGVQKTIVATSASGLNFNLPTGTANVTGGVGGGETGYGLKNAILGNAYFRTFEYEGNLYAFSNYGPLWKAPNAATPWYTTNTTVDVWEEIEWASNDATTKDNNTGVLSGGGNPVWDDLYQNYETFGVGSVRSYAGFGGQTGPSGGNAPRTGGPRHFATLMQDDGKTLEVWYTSRGEKPERIFRTTMDLSQSTWESWDTVVCDSNTVHQEMLRPELDWEGADQPLALSENGSEEDVNQLRDPYLFRDSDGKIYLFYTGEGEEAIGIALVHAADTDRDGLSDDDEAVAGTDPDNSNSVFRIENNFIVDSDFIQWGSITGRTYTVEYSTNLSSWISLDQGISATPPTNAQSIASAPDASPLFFRLSVEQ
jgi:hypothetical protein